MTINGVGLDAQQLVVTAQSQLLQPGCEQGVKFLISCALEAVNAQVKALLNHRCQFFDRNLVFEHLHKGFFTFNAVAVGLRA